MVAGVTDIAVTNHVINRTVSFHIALGTGWPLKRPEDCGPDVACYGILRGTGEAMKRAESYLYFDHGYFRRSSAPTSFDGYYRIVPNGLWPDCWPDDSDTRRFDALALDLKDWRKQGSHIVLVPPSHYMTEYLGLQDWAGETCRELRRYTDRPIVVHSKNSPTPFSEIIDGAWCVVTHHSNAAIDAMIEGIPAIMTGRGLGSLPEVESPPMRRDFFAKLANSQWTLKEIEEGILWRLNQTYSPST